MTPERLSAIVNKVSERYMDRRLNRELVDRMYKELSAVIRGLHRTEHFLDVHIDHNTKVIVVRDNDTFQYLGILPYLDNHLMRTDERYLVCFNEDGLLDVQCAIKFKDLYSEDSSDKGYIGFDIDIKSAIPLGIYYPKSKKFKRLEDL